MSSLKDFRGIIIEESLEDNRVLNDLEIVDFKITKDDNPKDRWHIYNVKVSKDDIEKLSRYIKTGKWYMHFWEGTDIIAVFKDKMFEFNYDHKASWKDVVAYGKSLGIPDEQLDFIID